MTEEHHHHHHDSTLRWVRCLDKVEIHGTSSNWESKKCFVLLVSLRDVDARKRAFATGGATRSTSVPFQIERTPAELNKLLAAMHHTSIQPHDKPCSLCLPIASGAIISDALRAAHDGESEAAVTVETSPGCFGFLAGDASVLRPRTDDEWEAWLNATIRHVRQHATEDAACDGARHIPALLAETLLDGFLSFSPKTDE